MRLRTWDHYSIRSAYLVRVLANSRRWNHCRSCGARMFVKPDSGLCPVCFTQEQLQQERVNDLVASSLAAEVADLPEIAPSLPGH
jgi:hypothetical protein